MHRTKSDNECILDLLSPKYRAFNVLFVLDNNFLYHFQPRCCYKIVLKKRFYMKACIDNWAYTKLYTKRLYRYNLWNSFHIMSPFSTMCFCIKINLICWIPDIKQFLLVCVFGDCGMEYSVSCVNGCCIIYLFIYWCNSKYCRKMENIKNYITTTTITTATTTTTTTNTDEYRWCL